MLKPAFTKETITPELEDEAELVFSRLGTTPDQAIKCFYEYVVREGKLPPMKPKVSKNEDVCFHIEKLKNIIYLLRCIAMKKALTIVNDEPHLNFWRLHLGIYLDTSVGEWCKIFGSESEDTHWKKSIPAARHDNFQERLLELLKINVSDWESYIKEMKHYRNTRVSHTDLNLQKKPENYPTLDHALESAFFYYEQLWLEYKDDQGISKSDLRNHRSLRDYYEKFRSHTIFVTDRAYQPTENIKELINYFKQPL